MQKHLQPCKESCFGTAAACLLEITPNEFYAYAGRTPWVTLHHEEIIRTLLKLGKRPVTLEFASSHDGVSQVDTGNFFDYFSRGILVGHAQNDMHAYAYEDGTCWNPNGRHERVGDISLIYGIDF